jgi:hypothetical protein
MGFLCLVCGQKIAGDVHVPKKCPNLKCNNSDISKFKRIDDEDLDPKAILQHEKDKKFLESRREK